MLVRASYVCVCVCGGVLGGYVLTFSRAQFFVTPVDLVHQACLFMEFSRQEDWSE